MEFIESEEKKSKFSQIANVIFGPFLVFWHSLKPSERLYLTSLVSIPIFNGSLVFASVLTAIGLIMEFWPRFASWWETLAGKAIFLVFYGGITNFALADAASLVNEVLGIAAEAVSYTHNFSILLILPKWFLGITFMTLLVFQVIMPFYLLLLLVLKLFGVKLIRVLSKSEHPIFSNLVRMCVSFILLYQIINILELKPETSDAELRAAVAEVEAANPNVKGLEQTKTLEPIDQKVEPTDKSVETEKLTPEQRGEKIAKAIQQSFQPGQEKSLGMVIKDLENAKDIEAINLAVDRQPTNRKEKLAKKLSEGHDEAVKQAIAVFAYVLESDDFSRCKLEPNTRAIEINDFEYLEISKSDTAEYGFEFIVKKCESPGLSGALLKQ